MAYSIQNEVEKYNHTSKIKIRLKEKANGYSIQLDTHIKGHPRHREVLKGLAISGRAQDKIKDTETLRIAETIRTKKERLLTAKLYAIPLSADNLEFLDYFKKCMNEKTEKNTKQVWNTTYNHLSQFFNGKKISLAGFNKDYVQKFKEYLDNKLQPSTVNTNLKRVKSAFNSAIQDDLLLKNPAKNLRARENETKIRYLESEDLTRLKIGSCKDLILKNAFLFSCYSGLRKGDIITLKRNEVNKGVIYRIAQKTNQTINIHIPAPAIALIEQTIFHIETEGTPRAKKALRENNLIFPLVASTTKISKRLKEWACNSEIANPDKLTYHMSRHTYATISLSAGVPITTIQKNMGHKNIATTLRYAKVLDHQKILGNQLVENYLKEKIG